jgi:hypothetical protein
MNYVQEDFTDENYDEELHNNYSAGFRDRENIDV